MWRSVLVVPLVTMVLPHSGAAGTPAAWQKKSLELVARVWKPPCETLTLEFAQPPDGIVAPDLVDSVTGWATPGECTIHLNEDVEWLGYPHMCSAVLHEGGHLVGREHSDRGIMQPFGFPSRGVVIAQGKREVFWESVDRRCVRPMDRR